MTKTIAKTKATPVVKTQKMSTVPRVIVERDVKLSKQELFDLCLDKVREQLEDKLSRALNEMGEAFDEYNKLFEQRRKDAEEAACKAGKHRWLLNKFEKPIVAVYGRAGGATRESRQACKEKYAIHALDEQRQSYRHGRGSGDATMRKIADVYDNLRDSWRHKVTSVFEVKVEGTRDGQKFAVEITIKRDDLNLKENDAAVGAAYDRAHAAVVVAWEAYQNLKVFEKKNARAKTALLRRLLENTAGGSTLLQQLDVQASSLVSQFLTE